MVIDFVSPKRLLSVYRESVHCLFAHERVCTDWPLACSEGLVSFSRSNQAWHEGFASREHFHFESSCGAVHRDGDTERR